MQQQNTVALSSVLILNNSTGHKNSEEKSFLLAAFYQLKQHAKN